MSKGKSASAAAKELKTTVKTMSKVTHNGVPIIKKVKGRWKAQFLPVYTHRLVVYGTMTGFNGTPLGRRKIPPNQATKKNLDKDYAEIWWQIDFDKFKSTLDSLDVGECHAPKIFEMLKQRLEQPSVFNPQLVTDFNTDPRIAKDITSSGRGTTPQNTMVSQLENMFKRYDSKFEDDYNWGVDDNMSPRPIDLLPVAQAAKKFYQPVGKFQIIVLRKGSTQYYPQTPLSIPYRVNVKDEEDADESKEIVEKHNESEPMKNNDVFESLMPDHMKDVIDSLNIENSKVVVSTETRRFGKQVTMIRGFEKGSNLKKIAKSLKSKCATGGTIKDEMIVLQGNQKKRVNKLLTQEGYQVEVR